MKKLIGLLVVFGAFAIFASTVVVAEGTNSMTTGAANYGTSSLRSTLNDQKDKLEQEREKLKEKTASGAAELKVKRQGYIREALGKIIAHLASHEQRLNLIVEKIDNRIEKAKANGLDVTSIQKALDNCEPNRIAVDAAIAVAKSKAAAIDPAVFENNSQVRSVREAIVSARAELMNYKHCLQSVLIQIKATKGYKEGSEGAK